MISKCPIICCEVPRINFKNSRLLVLCGGFPERAIRDACEVYQKTGAAHKGPAIPGAIYRVELAAAAQVATVGIRHSCVKRGLDRNAVVCSANSIDNGLPAIDEHKDGNALASGEGGEACNDEDDQGF